MGLAELAKAGATLGIKLAGNIAVPVTYVRFGTVIFDPTTGDQMTPTWKYAVTVVFANFSHMEIDQQVIQPNDKKILLASEALDFEPGINDEIWETHSGMKEVWTIINRRTDPALALWQLQVRKP